MSRHADNTFNIKGLILLCGVLGLLFFSACTYCDDKNKVDELNSLSYAYHYRNLDSAYVAARRALALSSGYDAGRAEAYNNLAFVHAAKMDYEEAAMLLDSVRMVTDNQVELLVADVQWMHLCQRESRNKDFYDYRERAISRIKRIKEEENTLSVRMAGRFTYACSEFAIVSSTYYYYVGLVDQSRDVLRDIDPSGAIQKDTAQYVSYLYQIGSGGILDGKDKMAVMQKEFESLLKCHILASQSGMVYWQANSLQSISEHLLEPVWGMSLLENNKAAFEFLNEDNMPDSLMAGYLAQRALDLFSVYGDVYQTAGAYRTLASCYWHLGDNLSALICLEDALTRNKAIEKSPSQVASIRECLSLVYSAMDDKVNSDINRNEYLDIQDETRQDRFLEARAEQLNNVSSQQNLLIVFIVILTVGVVVLLYVFDRLGKKKINGGYIENLLIPLDKWRKNNERELAALDDKCEEVSERLSLGRLRLEKDKRRSIDNKAKVFLVSNVLPFIDRIINEVGKLRGTKEAKALEDGRYAYISELADCINRYNEVLTNWIRIQQGGLNLHIESFRLNDVLSVLKKSEMSFKLKGIKFTVSPSDVVVKADKVLTLFMLNTIADNARKFTPAGGEVNVYVTNVTDYVEISVKDTGKGLSEKELEDIFNRKRYDSHGFGLMNCKGIIDKYKKISQIFNVCGLFVESGKGKGCRFYFRLPYGLIRCVVVLMSIMFSSSSIYAGTDYNKASLLKADAYADSAYYSNINGSYEKTLTFADSARFYLNEHYKKLYPQGRILMCGHYMEDGIPAEIQWFRDSVDTDYGVILDIRNESAVAALALHKWDLYVYNNKIYTQLFKELSEDKGLERYCLAMQNSSLNKTVAVVIFILLFLAVVFAFYYLYYRHVLYFRFCADNVEHMNKILLTDITDNEKLSLISNIDISRYPETLRNIITKIKCALEDSVAQGDSRNMEIEQMEDELCRIKYESEKMYISNSVIDNGLSALKHETMYYPSRIRQLVEDKDKNIEALEEVVSYYKDLYFILYEQVRRQADNVVFECKPVSMRTIIGHDELVLGDEAAIAYLFETLKKQFKFNNTDVSVISRTGKYAVFSIVCPNIVLTDEQCHNLFSPSVEHIPLFICRQIVRENAEQTNLHGCGIKVGHDTNGNTVINVTLARYSDKRESVD